MARRPLIAGNWKMNGLSASITLLDKIVAGAANLPATVDILVCPPFTLLAAFAARAQGTRVAIGGQDCHAEASGAHTGDIAAEMLADAQANVVIVGHSERRLDHHETDAEVRAKATAARRAGLVPVVCVGETRAERDAGKACDVISGQLAGSLPSDIDDFLIAYEPIWAIGTGLTPTPKDVADMHGFIRSKLAARFGGFSETIRILYGGSVKASNAGELLALDNVDGALVGGASLNAEEFLAIAAIYR
jgi:triosephosphate isomerase (TIM)